MSLSNKDTIHRVTMEVTGNVVMVDMDVLWQF